MVCGRVIEGRGQLFGVIIREYVVDVGVVCCRPACSVVDECKDRGEDGRRRRRRRLMMLYLLLQDEGLL